ncbi:MAG: ABC transporter ATP-binding protein [Hyphomicrobiaceae bacterium]|nr:ABC transporter ATP-binding protein [Hyphomicrobiaceae bacterium]MCC0022931.1 ABC transporter ATP-binding protein [Hyphomicrobiaceae bacterium]
MSDQTVPVLSLRRIAKHYVSGESVVRALDGVSLDIMPGELVGVVGPSGSGKSTMLLIAGLLETPTEGEVFVSGRLVSSPDANLDELRDFRRRNIGFVFQKANLLPFLTAAENVAIALEIDDVPARAALAYATELLEDVDLSHRIHNLPARLSGGEQQRVAVARALANDPTLLLADEPTAALDAVRGRQVIEQFRAIARAREAAVVVVTHDQRALEMFDRIIELVDGKLASIRTPGALEGQVI